jgi:hypothetical protein
MLEFLPARVLCCDGLPPPACGRAPDAVAGRSGSRDAAAPVPGLHFGIVRLPNSALVRDGGETLVIGTGCRWTGKSIGATRGRSGLRMVARSTQLRRNEL